MSGGSSSRHSDSNKCSNIAAAEAVVVVRIIIIMSSNSSSRHSDSNKCSCNSSSRSSCSSSLDQNNNNE